mgnify:FL=1
MIFSIPLYRIVKAIPYKNKKSPVSAATPTGEVTENQDEVIFQAVYIIIPPECAIFKNKAVNVIEKSEWLRNSNEAVRE